MKQDLKDVAILILVKFDSIERLENLLMTVNYIYNNFDTNIYVWEIGEYDTQIASRLLEGKIKHTFRRDFDPILHRTKYINEMVNSITERFVAVWDADVIVPAEQIVLTEKALKEGYEFVYPYESLFYDTSPAIRRMFYETNNIDIFFQYTLFMTEMYGPNPVGGVFFANRKSYIDSGLEQEKFYGWGIEDGERFDRWSHQQRKIKRIEGVLFHLSHPRGLNSAISSEYDRIVKKRLFFAVHTGI